MSEFNNGDKSRSNGKGDDFTDLEPERNTERRGKRAFISEHKKWFIGGGIVLLLLIGGLAYGGYKLSIDGLKQATEDASNGDWGNATASTGLSGKAATSSGRESTSRSLTSLDTSSSERPKATATRSAASEEKSAAREDE